MESFGQTDARSAWAFVTSTYPHVEMEYLHFVEVAKERTLHKLLQALVRERVVEVEEGMDCLLFFVSEEHFVEIPVSRLYLLGRFDVCGDVTFGTTEDREVLVDPIYLVRLLEMSTTVSISATAFAAFMDELENSVYNYALALTIAYERMSFRKEEAHRKGMEDVMAYVRQKESEEETFCSYRYFEQLVVEGHTLHPCAKTRLSMSVCDVAEYAPEWESSFALPLLAVRSDLVRTTNGSLRERLVEEYPFVKAALYEQELADYELLPVHPWQMAHTITENYAEELARRDFVVLEGCFLPVAPLVSFRSLAPLYPRQASHIKTALNVTMTSAVRGVSAASTKNGPVVSALLQAIQLEWDVRGMTFLQEYVGAHFQPKGEGENVAFLQKNVAALLRENPVTSLEKGEIALPAVTLLAESPVTGKLVMLDLIDTIARTRRLSKQAATSLFFKTYTDLLLPGTLTLMTQYGISLEAHLQNTVVVWRDDLPHRVMIRDYGGIRVMKSRLPLPLVLDDETNVVTENATDLHSVFSHAVLHNHLGELIVALTRHHYGEEAELFQIVSAKIKEVFASLVYEDAIEIDAPAVLLQPTYLKALVKMRLTGHMIDCDYVEIPNPFLPKEAPLQ